MATTALNGKDYSGADMTKAIWFRKSCLQRKRVRSWEFESAIRAGLFNSLLRSEKSPAQQIKEAARMPLSVYVFNANILS